MAKRDKDSRLQELFDSGFSIYSISKCNTINECLYEAYQNYILHKKGVNGIYGILGTRIHSQLQSIIDGTGTVEELPDILNQELEDLAMLNLSFPKDSRGSNSIRDNWIADMKHFCKTFQPPKGKFQTEQLVIYPLSEKRYVQGYIDLIRENPDGTISIYDWKTSTDFKAVDLLHHGRQLVFYALAKEAEGFTVRDVAWIMLKYCEVKFKGKKRANSKTKKEIVKVLSRGKLVSELKHHIESDLTELGYDEIDIEIMLDQALSDNSLDSLPDEVKSKYTVKPYVRKYEITDELKQETIDYLNRMADLYESLDTKDESQWPPRKFTAVNRNGKEIDASFFCRNLCNFRNTCIYLKRFLDQWELQKKDADEDADLF